MNLLSEVATTLDRKTFRDAMANLAAAVNVITTDGAHGKAGFTATAVCSVTDSPPTLLVCVNRNASVYEAFKGNGAVCVNTLGNGQEALSTAFGGKTPQAERFLAGSWSTGVSGAPLLDQAKVSFDCKVTSSVSVGTHDILFCEVLEVVQQAEADVLVYFDRRYHALAIGSAHN